MSWFSRIGTSANTVDVASLANEFPEDKLILRLISFINRTDLVADQIKKYERAKQLSAQEREMAYLQVFFALERFIINNKPLVVKREFTRESLRQDLEENIHLRRLKNSFRLIFMPPAEQSLYIGELGVAFLGEYIQKHLSTARLQYVVAQAVSGTILRTVTVTDSGIDFSSLDRLARTFTESNIMHAFRLFYAALLSEISVSIGEKNAETVMRAAYDFINQSYDQQIISRFLESLPEGVLDSERLAHLTRAELESKAASALASEKLRRELAEKLLEDSRRLELTLREERDRVHTILSSMGEGLVVIDQRFCVLLLNPAARRLLGLSTVNPIGQEISRYVTLMEGSQEVAAGNNILTQALSMNKVVATTAEDNYYFKVPDGRRFPVNLTITPLVGQQFSGLVIVFHDVTAEKKLSEARESFISIASHQLRTPLTPIRWFSQMLMQELPGKLNPEQKQMVSYVYESSDRLIGLLNFLLQISRVETGRLKVTPTPVDLSVLTDKVITVLKPLVTEKNLRITVESKPSAMPVIALDETIMFQVLQNVLSNAVRYSPEGGEVRVSMLRKDTVIEYAVHDNGVGIPKDQQSKIFEKFFRARNAVKMVPEGSGLGLSLVKALVEGWGGKIVFDSEENKGSTFMFTIPVGGMAAREGEVTLAV